MQSYRYTVKPGMVIVCVLCLASLSGLTACFAFWVSSDEPIRGPIITVWFLWLFLFVLFTFLDRTVHLRIDEHGLCRWTCLRKQTISWGECSVVYVARPEKPPMRWRLYFVHSKGQFSIGGPACQGVDSAPLQAVRRYWKMPNIVEHLFPTFLAEGPKAWLARLRRRVLVATLLSYVLLINMKWCDVLPKPWTWYGIAVVLLCTWGLARWFVGIGIVQGRAQMRRRGAQAVRSGELMARHLSLTPHEAAVEVLKAFGLVNPRRLAVMVAVLLGIFYGPLVAFHLWLPGALAMKPMVQLVLPALLILSIFVTSVPMVYAMSYFNQKRFRKERTRGFLLTPAQMTELAPLMQRVHRIVERASWLTALTVAVGITGGLFLVKAHLDKPQGRAVLDDWHVFGYFGFPLCGLFLGVVAGAFVHHWRAQVLTGYRGDLYERYETTRKGKYQGQLSRFWALLIVLMAVFLGLAGFNHGERVDEGGISWPVGFWSTRHRTYAQVAAIEFYWRVDAPLGIVNRPNMRVKFVDGAEALIDCGEGRESAQRLREIAKYVSERSGVPIVERDVRS